jgi:hypothetical protein
MIGALNSPGRFPRGLDRGKEHRHKHADDGNDDEQFDERKSAAARWRR